VLHCVVVADGCRFLASRRHVALSEKIAQVMSKT
jgi:hypothetical protein